MRVHHVGIKRLVKVDIVKNNWLHRLKVKNIIPIMLETVIDFF